MLANKMVDIRERYIGCSIECSTFGSMKKAINKKSKVLKRFPSNFKKPYTLMDRNTAFQRKVVGKKLQGSGRKKKRGRKKKK